MGSIGWRIILPRAAVALVVVGTVAGLIVLGEHRRHEHNPGAAATRVHFQVTGSAATVVAVEYGGDVVGPFSRNAALPFDAVERIHSVDEMYSTRARLHGHGRISCRVRIGDAIDIGRMSRRGHECLATLEWYGGLRGPAGWYRPSQLR
jgi:hypothetical protein